jgi:hypothetical protein
MHRLFAACVVAIALSAASTASAQNVATGSVALPAAGRTDGTARAGTPPAPVEAINYDTIHLEKRLSAMRSSDDIVVDGALDEPAWSSAPLGRDL